MTSNFPTSYDDAQSLFGDLEDAIILTLDGAISDSDTLLDFNEVALVDRLNLETDLTFLDKGVGPVTFTGSGLDDLSTGGTYVGFKKQTQYRVEIDGTGTPDTFRWSNDGGATWEQETVAITGSAQTLEYGLTVTFGATTGHTLADRWDFDGGFEIVRITAYDSDMDAAIADDGGVFTDETTASNDATADDMTLLPAAPAVNDAYYFGRDTVFDELELNISTAGAGTWTIAWEYWNGTGWSALSGVTDGTTGFTVGGVNKVTYTVPGDWATTSVNSQGPFYYIRARVSAFTSITTQPLGQQSRVLTGEVTVTRGYENSTAHSHADVTQATQDPQAHHFNRLRDALIAAEKYKGLVGTSLPANCGPTEMFVKTDTDQVYVCFATDVWTLVNRPDHGEYANLGADDHTQLHTEARKDTWHAGLTGDHLSTPTTHDHDGSGTEGNPIKKFATGLDSNKGTPSAVGQVWYGHDQNNLYFSDDGATWTRYTTMPEGTLLYFEGSCPTGWTVQSSLNGKFLKGAPTATWTGLEAGGRATHEHDMPDVIAHQHSVKKNTGLTVGSVGGHTHTFPAGSGTGFHDNRPFENNSASGPNFDISTSDSGNHSHTLTVPQRNADNQGDAPEVSAAIADDGGVFTDETTAANNSTVDDMTLLPASPVVNDAYYFGYSKQFDRFDLDISTAGAGTWTIIWEYWNGTGWSALSNVVDDTEGFTVVNRNQISWDLPGDWATTTVNSQGPFYYIRARVSAFTSITTQPLGEQTFVTVDSATVSILPSYRNLALCRKD